jgi:hypothetical protein
MNASRVRVGVSRRHCLQLVVIAGLGVQLATLGESAVCARAAEFNGPTSYVDLPGFKPEELATKVAIATGVSGDASGLQAAILPPDAPFKGVIDSYEASADATTKSLKIEAITRSKARKPVATLTVEGDSLMFQWVPTVVRGDGVYLRNCVLTIAGSPEQAIALRKPLTEHALILDLQKDLMRIPLTDDLPDDSLLTLAVSEAKGAEVAGSVSAPTGLMRQPVFVGLKAAADGAPGVQLRVVLWRQGTRPEVIIRPELTKLAQASAEEAPAAAAAPAAPLKSTTLRGNFRTEDDPTKPNPDHPAFTTRSLTTAKATTSRQWQLATNRLEQARGLVVARQNELNQFDADDDSPEDVMRIAQLQQEVGLLTQEANTIEQQLLPALQKQLTAFEPLEKFRAAIHQKATLSLRVSYTVAGKPVDVLIVGDAAAK